MKQTNKRYLLNILSIILSQYLLTDKDKCGSSVNTQFPHPEDLSIKAMMFLNLLVFVVFSVPSVICLDAMCSSDTFENKCLCKKVTNEDSNLPGSLADCNGMGYVNFPDFSLLPSDLTILDLTMNQIQILDSTSASPLRKLILAYNDITEVRVEFFRNLTDLVWLDLSRNQLSTLDADVFLPLKGLVYLDLSYNSFQELPGGVLAPLALLRFLDLSYNPLGEFLGQSEEVFDRNLGASANISHLLLNSVNLNDFHPNFFGPYTWMRHLELQDNNFNYIPALPNSLEYLDFSGNNLSFVSPAYLPYSAMKVLRLSRMPSLENIHHYAFYNLVALEKLIITDCPNVRDFTDYAFGLASKTVNIHPKKLVLARNGLNSLNSTYAHMFRNMDHIELSHNPWECNCNVLWLQEFNKKIFRSAELRCSSPSHLAKKRVLSLTHQDLPECFPEIYGKTSHRVTIIILMSTVLFLMGLVFYLIRYPKTWINPNQLGIGPHSPYSQAPQVP